MLSRLRKPVRTGFVEPCLPSPAPRPPAGAGWLHEIKHDGYRLMARRDAGGIRLLTRNGYDWSARFPLIVQAVNKLHCRSCLVDGEAVACDDDGLPVFERMRSRRHDKSVILFAFDLIELDGLDLRRTPIEGRKLALDRVLRGAPPGLQLCEHLDGEDGATVFRHACKLGLEGIVSKRRGSPYRSGRSIDWLKSKNPASAAVRREAEEDWSK